MKKMLFSLILLFSISANASEAAKAVVQAKPVLIKNAVDKTVGAFKYLADTKVCKFFADNKVVNTVTQDEYVQKAWADKLGKATLCAAPFYLIALAKINKTVSYDTADNNKPRKVVNIATAFSALNWAVVGAIVHATTYAYLNK